DRRNEGQPILRSYYRSSFVKQYEKGDRLLRTETCLNNTYDLGIGRRLEHLPELRARMAATNTRYLDTQAEVLASTVDAGALAALARPVAVGRRRGPGPRLGDGRGLPPVGGPLPPRALCAHAGRPAGAPPACGRGTGWPRPTPPGVTPFTFGAGGGRRAGGGAGGRAAATG